MSAILKQKLIDIANGFTKYGLWKGGTEITVDSELSTTSTNPVQNKVITSNLTSLNEYKGTILSGQDKEIYFKPLEYFEITVIGNSTRMCKIIGQFRPNGTPDYWVDKPSESTIQVSSNTNRIIIGNPTGDGSVDIFVKYIKKVD